jgi:Domain of unknown function (DUF4406)
MGSGKLIVYIAGPYSLGGDVGHNVHQAMHMWRLLWDHGYIPYCPHWSHFQHLVTPLAYEDWLDYDREFLAFCDVLMRMEGESKGADLEVKLALELHIPVVNSLQALLDLHPLDGKSTTRKNRRP